MNLLLLDFPLFQSELRQAGHRVVSVGTDPACEIRLAVEKYDCAHIQAALPDGFQPDLVLISETLKKRRFPAGLGLLRVPLVWYSIDAHLHLDWHLRYARHFDLVLATQLNVCDALQQTGIEVHWLPWSIDETRLPHHPDGMRDIDVSMVGSFNPALRPRRLHILEDLNRHFRVRLFGPPFGPWLSEQQVREVYRRSRVVLNESVRQEINFRVFESMAEGACLLTDEVPGLDRLYRIGVDLMCYKRDTLVETLRSLLSDEVRRAGVAASGMLHTRQHHLRKQRCSELLEVLEHFLLKHRNRQHQRGSGEHAPRRQLAEEAFCWRRAASTRIAVREEADLQVDLRFQRITVEDARSLAYQDPDLLIEYAEWLWSRSRSTEARTLLKLRKNGLLGQVLAIRAALDELKAQTADHLPSLETVMLLADGLAEQGRIWQAGVCAGDSEDMHLPCWSIQLLQHALSLRPNSLELLHRLACHMLLNGNPDAALDALTSYMIQGDPETEPWQGAMLLRAGVLDHLHRRTDAVLTLIGMKGLVYHLHNRNSPGIAPHLKEALARYWPGEELRSCTLRFLDLLTKGEDGLEELIQQAQRDADSPAGILAANQLLQQGRAAQANQLLGRALMRAPRCSRLLTLKARVLESMGRKDAASLHLDRARRFQLIHAVTQEVRTTEEPTLSHEAMKNNN